MLGEGGVPDVSSVSIVSIVPNPAKVGETVTVTAKAYLTEPAQGGDYVIFVLAVGDKSNFVTGSSVALNPGDTEAVTNTLQVAFDQPGSYTVWVGARYEPPGGGGDERRAPGPLAFRLWTFSVFDLVGGG